MRTRVSIGVSMRILRVAVWTLATCGVVGGAAEGVQAQTTQPSSGSATSRVGVPTTFAAMKVRADKSTKPLEGVALWQQFIDQPGLAGEEKEKGKAELKVWQDRETGKAILVKKAWVMGDERDKVVKEVSSLLQDAMNMYTGGQAVSAVPKLKEAAKIWPENFEVQFLLGRIAIDKRDEVEALWYFEACRRIRPQSVAVMNNLALVYLMQKPPQFERSLSMFYEASKGGDTKELAQSFRFAMLATPDPVLRRPQLKAAKEAMNLLSGKYGLNGPGQPLFMNPNAVPDGHSQVAGKDQKGIIGSGSGFVISPDGWILTNKHVAGMGDAVLVKFNDGTQLSGELIKLDDEQDLALVKVKTDKPLPFVKLAKRDNPADGATAVIMGYPAPELLGYSCKTTSGAVSTGTNSAQSSDVTLDARVNPGNSGGPVYDMNGNVMAIIAQKTTTNEEMHMDSYGLAISIGRVRKFLKKNNVEIEIGADDGTPLTTEQIAERNKPATVCLVGLKN